MWCDVRTAGKKPSIAKWYSDSKSNFNNNDGGSDGDGDDTGIDDDDEHETVESNDPTNEREETAGKVAAAVVSSSSSSSLSSSSLSSMLDDPSMVDIPPPIYSLILFGPPGTLRTILYNHAWSMGDAQYWLVSLVDRLIDQ